MGWRAFFGLKENAGSVSLSGPAAVVTSLPVKRPSKHQTVADRLDWLCKKYNATYTREVKVDGVVVKMYMDGGDTVISGRGENTGAAVKQLFEKLELPK